MTEKKTTFTKEEFEKYEFIMKDGRAISVQELERKYFDVSDRLACALNEVSFVKNLLASASDQVDRLISVAENLAAHVINNP